MKRFVLAVGTLALGAAMLVSALAAVAKPGPAPCPHPPQKWADLDVSKVTIHIPGVPSGSPYLVQDRNGSTQHFDVHVDIKNIGGAAACKSRLLVVFAQNSQIRKKRYLTVPDLAPGHSALVVVDVPNLKLQGLEPLETVAHVNYNGHVPELNPHNNLDYVKPDTPVLAKYWKVTRWTLHGVQPAPPLGGLPIDFNTRVDPGFYFQFSRYDQQFGIFFYNAYGGITEDIDQGPGVVPGGDTCSGTSTGHASHSPWPTSTLLGINYTATKYRADTDTKAAGDKYTTTTTCSPSGDVLTDSNARFGDLYTYPGETSTSQGATHLTGGPVTETQPQLGGLSYTFTYSWTFDADVP